MQQITVPVRSNRTPLCRSIGNRKPAHIPSRKWQQRNNSHITGQHCHFGQIILCITDWILSRLSYFISLLSLRVRAASELKYIYKVSKQKHFLRNWPVNDSTHVDLQVAVVSHLLFLHLHQVHFLVVHSKQTHAALEDSEGVPALVTVVFSRTTWA